MLSDWSKDSNTELKKTKKTGSASIKQTKYTVELKMMFGITVGGKYRKNVKKVVMYILFWCKQ